jgi:hypothetical protein
MAFPWVGWFQTALREAPLQSPCLLCCLRRPDLSSGHDLVGAVAPTGIARIDCTMAKSRDSKKQVRKQPLKTLKEKKLAKLEKKKAR